MKPSASSDLRQMIELHVKWQLAHLELTNPGLERYLVERFHRTHAQGGGRKRAICWPTWWQRGFELGVVSNGCGNVEKLCADFGYAPFLSVIVDSRRVGLFKPDPAIFVHAAGKLGRNPGEILMVGDSFDRDVRPAKKIGMKTAWLEGLESRDLSRPVVGRSPSSPSGRTPGALATLSPAFA